MSKTPETLNLFQKLAKIRKLVEVVQKNKSGYGYKYVTDDELLAKITAGMDKYGVSLIPNITPETFVCEPYTYTKTKGGKEEIVNEVLTRADMTYTWVDNENPEQRITVNWITVGQQSDASQSFGSGLTYSMRYFLLKYFNVATPESDPDAWRSKQRAAEKEEELMLAKKTVDQIHEMVSGYLSANASKAAEVRKFLTGYVKNGDYFKITDPALAAKLLEEFNNKYVKGE